MKNIITDFLLSYEDEFSDRDRSEKAYARSVAHYSGLNSLRERSSRRSTAEIAAELEAKPSAQRERSRPTTRYEVLRKSGFRCLACGASPKDGKTTLHVDHVVPLAQGGEDKIENMQALCADCNKSKGARFDDDLR